MSDPDRRARARWMNEIRENPDDDGVRLRCASWFASLGGEANAARAEFILTQIERARLPPDSPRHSELHAREVQLVVKHWRAWCAGARLLRRPIFRRGFVERVHVHLREFYWHRRELFALEPVRDVRFTGWWRTPDEFVQRVARCEELRHLEALTIHHQGPHKDPADSVVTLLESPHLSNLRTLETTYCGFKPEATRRFCELPVLRHVTSLTTPVVDRHDWDAPKMLASNPDAVRGWGFSKKLDMLEEVTLDVLRACAENPGWQSLEELTFSAPASAEIDDFLARNTPRSLKTIAPDVWCGRDNDAVSSRLLALLAELPVRTVRFGGRPELNEALAPLLDAPRWELESVSSYDAQLLPRLANRRATRQLRHLQVSATTEGLDRFVEEGGVPGSLVSASLQLYGPVQPETLVRFLRSPSAANLVSFNCTGPLTDDVAAALCALPSLTVLRWSGEGCAPEVRRTLEGRFAEGWLRLDLWGTDGTAPLPSRAEAHLARGAASVIPLDGYAT